LIVEDFFFHVTHRILHIKWIYPHIHKLHHKYIDPIGIASEYTHPVEFAFGNMFPTGMPALLLGDKMHFFTFIIWISVRIVVTVY
jgi:sterol desaturase/sphingolipid hydroxylase (fatty acid hydroxylase superfamily)